MTLISLQTRFAGGRYEHGASKTYLYACWRRIRIRCHNPDNEAYKFYGGRGIAVYEGWLYDFTVFRDWILTNLGPRPVGRSLDRKNNNGNYEPGNLRWATPKQQANNRRKKSHYRGKPL
jgi:Staphylococcus phage HNH endonuclease